MLREEETKWYQRVKVKELLEGGSNTKYSQFITSGKHRKTQIFWLQHNDMIIEGDHELKIYVTSYYKDIFGQPAPSSFSLDESRVNDIVQVSAQENDVLISPFMMDDVWEAIFQMEYNKAPCPDGFSVEFYQSYWEIVKDDLMVLFREFYRGDLPLYSLNFGTMNLQQKCREAEKYDNIDTFVC
jgi:hypothetical protein